MNKDNWILRERNTDFNFTFTDRKKGNLILKQRACLRNQTFDWCLFVNEYLWSLRKS